MCPTCLIRGLLFQWINTIKKSNLSCWSSTKRTSSSFHWKLTFLIWKISELPLNSNLSLTNSLYYLPCVSDDIYIEEFDLSPLYNFSTKIISPGISDDRLVNASQNNLRSYVTVNRPAPGPGQPRASTFSSKYL